VAYERVKPTHYFSFLRKEEKRKTTELMQSPCCVRILAYARQLSTFSRLTNFPETLLERSAIVGDTNAVHCNFLQLVRNNNLPSMRALCMSATLAPLNVKYSCDVL